MFFFWALNSTPSILDLQLTLTVAYRQEPGIQIRAGPHEPPLIPPQEIWCVAKGGVLCNGCPYKQTLLC